VHFNGARSFIEAAGQHIVDIPPTAKDSNNGDRFAVDIKGDRCAWAKTDRTQTRAKIVASCAPMRERREPFAVSDNRARERVRRRSILLHRANAGCGVTSGDIIPECFLVILTPSFHHVVLRGTSAEMKRTSNGAPTSPPAMNQTNYCGLGGEFTLTCAADSRLKERPRSSGSSRRFRSLGISVPSRKKECSV
jgi:hypothetical protein